MDYVTCTNCRCRTWVDRAAWGDKDNSMRFKCTRCGKLIKLTGCSKCGATRWIRENDLYEKGSRKPIVRYRCEGCGRIVGLCLDHDH